MKKFVISLALAASCLKASDQPLEPIPLIQDQYTLIEKILAYLQKEINAASGIDKQNRIEAFRTIEQFKKGICKGLTSIWSYGRYLTDIQEQPLPATDNSQFFTTTHNLLLNWDEKSSFSTEEKNDIERFIGHVRLFQNAAREQNELFRVQNNLLPLIEDPKRGSLTFLYGFTLHPENEQLLSKQLSLIIKPSKIILFSLGEKNGAKSGIDKGIHVGGIYKDSKGTIYAYDPNEDQQEHVGQIEQLFTAYDELARWLLTRLKDLKEDLAYLQKVYPGMPDYDENAGKSVESLNIGVFDFANVPATLQPPTPVELSLSLEEIIESAISSYLLNETVPPSLMTYLEKNMPNAIDNPEQADLYAGYLVKALEIKNIALAKLLLEHGANRSFTYQRDPFHPEFTLLDTVINTILHEECSLWNGRGKPDLDYINALYPILEDLLKTEGEQFDPQCFINLCLDQRNPQQQSERLALLLADYYKPDEYNDENHEFEFLKKIMLYNTAVFRKILSKKPFLTDAKNWNEETIIFYAPEEFIDELVRQGMDINTTNKKGDTPLSNIAYLISEKDEPERQSSLQAKVTAFLRNGADAKTIDLSKVKHPGVKQMLKEAQEEQSKIN